MFPITVPRLGWSMDEGTFVGWLKKDGESVSAGDPLYTLEGDKASQEVEATESGILRIAPDGPKAGDPVAVGALLGYLAGQGEASPPAPGVPPPLAPAARQPDTPPSERPAPAATQPPSAPPAADRPAARIAISPRARRRALELGVDWNRLRGSGRTGRILEADVLEAAKGAPSPAPSGMRRTIAQRTSESFARAPHFYLRTEVDAGPLLKLRENLLSEVERVAQVRLTLTDLLLRAQALALLDCPFANAIWQNDRVVRFAGCDVGLVVGLDDGLLIPIVRAPEAGGLAALAQQRAALVKAARAGQLAAETMQGGASSLSNLGGTCVDEFAAVISPPQSTMLAVGRAAPRPFVAEGQLVVRTTLKLCLSVDHRVMDGGAAAEFLGRMVELMEEPAGLTCG
jgi:pyruvate dehydrogenase E2 component (dihydrolipoamide acetyltransferase)